MHQTTRRTLSTNGALTMVWASLAFAVMAAFIKAASARLPAIQLVWMRCLLALPLMAFLLARSGQAWTPTNRAGIVLRSIFGIGAMTLSFYGLSKLTLADQFMLSKTNPVWIAILSPLFLGERTNRLTWWCMLGALLGCALVLRPSLAVGNIAGLAVLAAALFSALAHMTLRRLSATDSTTVIVFWFCVWTTLLTTPAVLYQGVWPTVGEWLALSAVAVSATAGQMLMTQAYALDEAPVISASGYSNVVFGMVLGYLIWDEIPTVWSWVGGALVVGSGLVLVLNRRGAPRRFSPVGSAG